MEHISKALSQVVDQLASLKDIQLGAISSSLIEKGYTINEIFLPDCWTIHGRDADYLLQWTVVPDLNSTVGGNWQFFFESSGNKSDEFYRVEYAIKTALFDVEMLAQEIGLND